MITIAINGFGRIGRNFLRAILKDPNAQKQIKVSVINMGPGDIHGMAHMFKYDTLMGTFPGSVTMKDNSLVVDGHTITVIAETDPKKIDWKKYGVEWVVESSGHFTKRDQALMHCASGAAHVLITAPAEDADVYIIPGINENTFNPATDRIVSMGSCTTNAFIPMLKMVQDLCGIKEGFMTTVHSYTNTQVLLDVQTSDLRRSRAAALNIIPTTTGASEMLDKVMPALKDKITSSSLRVPVGKVSIIDLSVLVNRAVTVQELNQACEKHTNITMKGIVGFTMEPLVSSDFSGVDYSVTIDGQLTGVQGNMIKLFGWYDNEWGYSVRLKDLLVYVATKK